MQSDIINCDYLAAALLARMSPQTVTAPVKLDRDRWYRRFAVLGYSSISDDPLTAIIRHDELPGSCSRVIGKRHLPAINAWFYQCRRDEIPDIYVSIARKYVRLVWDCILKNGNGAKGDGQEGQQRTRQGDARPLNRLRNCGHDFHDPVPSDACCPAEIVHSGHRTNLR